MQRGLADARDAGGIDGVLLLAMVVSLVPAITVAVAIAGDPHQPTTEPVDRHAPRVELAAGERAQWSGVAQSTTAMLVGLAAVVLVVALAALTQLWALLIVALLLTALVAAMSSVVVRIEGDRAPRPVRPCW